MSLTLNFPLSAEQAFLTAWGDRLEALAIEGYREGKLSLGTLAELLGFATTHEADRRLAERCVPLNYSENDFREDCRTLGRLRSPES